MTTELFEAIQKGDEPTVIRLIDQSPDLVNTVNSGGVSAVLWSKYVGQNAITALLIGRGAALDVFSAAACNATERLAALLDAYPASTNAHAPDGFQPLGLASFFGSFDAAKLLIERGAEVNSPSQNGMRVMPLHSAVAGNYLDIARLLLEHGAQVNITQADAFMPLHGAAQNGNAAMIRLLLDHDADPSLPAENGKMPLDYARESGDAEAITILSAVG